MNTTPQPPRWHYRFDNYSRAFERLGEALEIMRQRQLTQLEKEGLIQRFEYTWELAWKLLKDYLEHSGIVLETVTPTSVIKAAFAAKFIHDADAWMHALDARNKMSHTYDLKAFDAVIPLVANEYFALLATLHQQMNGKKQAGEMQ